ncbi:MAG: riboflavin synthase [Rhodospirillaceae bacterium]
MFTGIITDLGEVAAINTSEGGAQFIIRTHYDTNSIDIGASISCSGCCLTVISKEAGKFVVDVSNESLNRTTIGNWIEGTKINLERSMKLGEELGGHLVSGHVDCVASVGSTEADGMSTRLRFTLPAEYSRFIAEKGSIAVDGVSLTVNDVSQTDFGVNVIPHTSAVTTFGGLQVGDTVNIELDMLARYVARLLNSS